MLDVIVAVIKADIIALLLLFITLIKLLDVREPCFVNGSWCCRTIFCFGS